MKSYDPISAQLNGYFRMMKCDELSPENRMLSELFKGILSFNKETRDDPLRYEDGGVERLKLLGGMALAITHMLSTHLFSCPDRFSEFGFSEIESLLKNVRSKVRELQHQIERRGVK